MDAAQKPHDVCTLTVQDAQLAYKHRVASVPRPSLDANFISATDKDMQKVLWHRYKTPLQTNFSVNLSRKMLFKVFQNFLASVTCIKVKNRVPVAIKTNHGSSLAAVGFQPFFDTFSLIIITNY